MIVFEDFPTPPSDNHLYPTFMRAGRLIRVPSKEYAQFRKSVESWGILNAQKLKWAQEAIRNFDKLGIEFVFHFEPHRLFTLKGTVKKLDVSNRIKAAQDSISKLLGVDDSIFFTCTAHKVPALKDGVTIYLWGAQLELDSDS